MLIFHFYLYFDIYIFIFFFLNLVTHIRISIGKPKNKPGSYIEAHGGGTAGKEIQPDRTCSLAG
jgi:hypothetical protein